MSYIDGFDKVLLRVSNKKRNIQIVFSVQNSNNNIPFPNFEDLGDKSDWVNITYRISYWDYNIISTRQACRHLKFRVKEHNKSAEKKNTSSAKHGCSYSHNFDSNIQTLKFQI